MRAFVQCSLAWASFAAILSGHALQPPDGAPQPPQEIEEVVVIGGKTLSQYRLELEQAQDDLFKLFNQLNERNDTDVNCRDEVPTGSRIPQRVCWSSAQDRATATFARAFLTGLTLGAGSASEGAANGIAAAHNAEKDGERAAVQFEEEWGRVLGGDQQFAEAVAKYAELEAEFDRLSGVASVSAPQPRQIQLGGAGTQCEASTLTEFEQRDNVARVSGTVSISMCPAGTTGAFTLVANVRDDAGAITPLEFSETWQRADAQDHIFNSDYPIGDNVDVVSVRVRNLTCTCESPAQ
jgi:hypothetical protein